MAQRDDSARDEHGLLRHLPFLGRVSRECIGGDGPVKVEPVYYGEVFTNTRGGIATSGATQYEGLLDLAMTVEFDNLSGKFFPSGAEYSWPWADRGFHRRHASDQQHRLR